MCRQPFLINRSIHIFIITAKSNYNKINIIPQNECDKCKFRIKSITCAVSYDSGWTAYKGNWWITKQLALIRQWHTEGLLNGGHRMTTFVIVIYIYTYKYMCLGECPMVKRQPHGSSVTRHSHAKAQHNTASLFPLLLPNRHSATQSASRNWGPNTIKCGICACAAMQLVIQIKTVFPHQRILIFPCYHRWISW